MQRRDFLKKCIVGAAVSALPLTAIAADAPKADNKVVGLEPGGDDHFLAMTHPGVGRIPEKVIWGDPVHIPTYTYTEFPSAENIRAAMQRSWERQELNNALEAWDEAVFNYTHQHFDCSHIYCSPEALEDIKNWGVDQIDETTRKEIMVNGHAVNQKELAESLSEPLRHGVLAGNIVKDVYETIPLPPGAKVEFPLDLRIDEDEDFETYVTPNTNQQYMENVRKRKEKENRRLEKSLYTETLW